MKFTEKQFIEWIKKQIQYYKPILGINLLEVNVEPREETQYLDIVFVYPYLDSTIRFNHKALDDFNKGKLKKDRILHELCHIITDPFYSKAFGRFCSKQEIEDERERLTDNICLIIRNLDK